MRTKANQTSGAEGVQVFELTMDNPEDQDELNRRLQKPGEPDRSMLLVAIIGTGPMQSILAQADVELWSEWITAGAVIPATMG